MEEKILANNRKASFNYFILKKYQAGIQLEGCEVKSIRARECSINDAFVSSENGEIFIRQMHIKPYEKQYNFQKVDPYRSRKLLLTKKEIREILGALSEKGVTAVPLNVKLVGRYIKLDIAIVKGKHSYDKRQAIAKRDANRAIDRAIKYN